MLKLLKTLRINSLRQLSKFASANEALDQRGDVLNLSELSNGLRVASSLNSRPTTTIGVWIAGGSQLETNENNGVATVFENLVHTHSTFFVECFPNDVEKVVELLSDVLTNTNIEQSKLEQQRADALKRLDSYEDENRQGVVMD
uniref:Peptidase M16 N-terminal domain-containing protein n=1 Tax=Meloidogyne incognita TaxID=6306 RepID=A0A914NW64_MELIC